jgi:crossover junction endodeoxyribonuclease RuvC
MALIIGIDPGSRITGYGIIRCEGNQSYFVDCGSIKVTAINVGDRLQQIYAGIQEVIKLHQPQEAAVEQVFMHQNPGSALKLGQARGAAIVALNLPIAEYSARQVKQSVVGYGAAKKEQVQHMVQRILNLSTEIPLQADAADALAIALCHAHSRNSLKLNSIYSKSKKKTSWRSFIPLIK